MVWRWSSGVLNSLVAPNVTTFTQAVIPDLTERFPEAQHWLVNFFLNSVGRGRYKPRVQQVALGYLRRAHHAFLSYHDARRTTLEYLDGNDPYSPRLRTFYAAVALWETCALQISMAISLYNWLSRPERAFEKNDGSKEDRLYTIANHIKHVSSCVDEGQCTEQATMPLWLSNDGLVSFGVSVTYTEVSEILADVASFADLIQDPLALASAEDSAADAVESASHSDVAAQ